MLLKHNHLSLDRLPNALMPRLTKVATSVGMNPLQVELLSPYTFESKAHTWCRCSTRPLAVEASERRLMLPLITVLTTGAEIACEPAGQNAHGKSLIPETRKVDRLPCCMCADGLECRLETAPGTGSGRPTSHPCGTPSTGRKSDARRGGGLTGCRCGRHVIQKPHDAIARRDR